MAIHSNILFWRIPWTQEPGRLQCRALQRVRHYWSNLALNEKNHRGKLIHSCFTIGVVSSTMKGKELFFSSYSWEGPWGGWTITQRMGLMKGCLWVKYKRISLNFSEYYNSVVSNDSDLIMNTFYISFLPCSISSYNSILAIIREGDTF